MTTDTSADQELLTLAAKAARFGDEFGVTWTESEYPRNSSSHGALWNYRGHMDTAELWNPLTDDGDALRLAVKLRLNISVFDNYVIVGYYFDDADGLEHHVVEESINGDHNAAVRGAIVRAAAQIGEHQNA